MDNFIDANDTNVPDKIRTSICIVGAGAAGITLARELVGIDDVLVIESGDFEMVGGTQNLYSGLNIGLPYYDLLQCRLRYFGGTTNHWGGYCRANDPIDYEGREELGLPEWPIEQATIDHYVDKAARELGFSSGSIDPSLPLKNKGIASKELLEHIQPDFSTKVFQITTRVRFSKIYRSELAKQKNLKIFLNLNVVHIQLSPDGSKVDSLTCKTLKGKKIVVEAGRFVLASHAIENARLLLNSNDIHKQGVGNQHDHVGRYFMEHPHIIASKIIPSDKFPRLYNRDVLRGLNLNANVSFTDDYLRRTGLLQYYCRFIPVYANEAVVDGLRRINGDVTKPFSKRLFDDIKIVANNFSDSVDFMVAKYGINQPDPKYYLLEHRIEQAPNPESRVLISKTKDDLGVPQADLQWKLNEHDYRTFKNGQEKIIKELSALGFGRFIVEEITTELVNSRVEGHSHHIGTTRMSQFPEDGVVDSNCKIHSLSNLYVAGGSVFPTAGYSGPTMMIVAFAMRLADHLKK